ncbi:caspase family protein [bacterium]|nr:caspase family protein [bacterium]
MARWIAFLVGVDEYKFLEKLKGAKNDAESLWKVLIDPKIGLFDKDASRLVLNPTKYELEQALALFFDGLRANDVLLLYFAGHGAALQNKLYLATTDTRLMKSDYINPATATPFGVVEDLLRYSPSKSVMTVIDACQSATLGEDIAGLRNALGTSVHVSRSLGQGYQYLSACRPHQLAQETTLGNAHHGQLTAAVIEAVRSGANVPRTEEFITFTAISRFVQDQMSNLENQQPVQFNSDLVSPITMARNINFKPPKNWLNTFDKYKVDILQRFQDVGEGLHHAINILEPGQWSVWRKLKHWGVIESPKNGYGRITERGRQFLRGEIDLPKTLGIKNDKVVTTSSETINIKTFFPEGL